MDGIRVGGLVVPDWVVPKVMIVVISGRRKQRTFFTCVAFVGARTRASSRSHCLLRRMARTLIVHTSTDPPPFIHRGVPRPKAVFKYGCMDVRTSGGFPRRLEQHPPISNYVDEATNVWRMCNPAWLVDVHLRLAAAAAAAQNKTLLQVQHPRCVAPSREQGRGGPPQRNAHVRPRQKTFGQVSKPALKGESTLKVGWGTRSAKSVGILST